MLLPLLLFLLFLIFAIKRNSGKIPGPLSLPFMGSTPVMIMSDSLQYPYRMMYRLSKKYGNVFQIGLGSQDWIMLSSLPEIKEFAMSDHSVAHLQSQTFDELYSFDRPLGIIFPDGPLWKEQRKFGVKTLRELGVGKSSLDEKILLESQKSCQYLLELIGNQSGLIRMDDYFDLPCLNVIWGLVNDTRYSYDDHHLKAQIELINKFTMDSSVGPLVGVEYLKYIPPFNFIYKSIKKHMDVFKASMRKLVKDEKNKFDNSELSGYIHYFLAEQEKTSTTFYEDDQLVVSLIDFFTGGSGTMSKTLAFAILLCAKHPRVMKKVQKEIDEYLGDREEVELDDKPNLPYVEATCLEVSRLASVLPIAPPRKTTGEIKVGAYTLPKGSLVQMNLYAMHRNAEHWDAPHEFRPERFIKDGKFFQDEWVQPFGYGKRKCLGEAVARNNTFLMFSNMMRKFDFAEGTSSPLPSTEDPVGGLSIGPQKFYTQVTKRR